MRQMLPGAPAPVFVVYPEAILKRVALNQI